MDLNRYDYRFAFRVFDQTGDGYLTLGELRHIMINFAARLSEEQVDELIDKANIHVDSLVNYDEFAKMIESQ